MTPAAILDGPAEVAYWEEEEFGEAPEDSREDDLLDRFNVREDEDVAELRTWFELLADELGRATSGMSSTRRAVRHPAYREILALGESSIPLLIERLDDPINRPLWLRLLGSLTTLQPGAGKGSVEDAAEAWVRWAKVRDAATPRR
jgi:hypothetical protein